MIDAIFVPRGAEERAVRRALARAGRRTPVFCSGIGPAAAAAAARGISAPTVRRVLATGLCGSLSRAFTVGDVLVYHDIRRPDGPPLRLDPQLTRRVADGSPSLQSGIRALASDAIVTRAREKHALAERYGLDAVDMETFAFATPLQDAGIAVAALRVASDGVDDDLPDLDRALDAYGGLDGFALSLAMLRRPRAGVRLARHAMHALAVLESAVFSVVSSA